jgi:hypothetical protein
LNEDGSHTCNGKWAITREHFNNGQVSNFQFRLEPHLAAESAKAKGVRTSDDAGSKDAASVSLAGAPPGSNTFPLDSAMYKGSFKMKRGASKFTTVIDQQIVLKFRKNTAGSYNVYGKGVNSIGIFNLMGTLILSGKSSGHVELYRMYPVVPKSEAAPGAAKHVHVKPKLPTRENAAAGLTGPPTGIPRPPQGLIRRESSRLTKLPSRLEDDDPQALLSRMMDKCSQILKIIREKDIASGAFFGEPVDPVAHGIPTYYQIIKEPMDLGTIQRKLDSKDILTPEEFGRLVRLVFENAMTFNVEPSHVVHQAARNLLILFNQKFRDVERTVESLRKSVRMTEEEAVRLGQEEKASGKRKKQAPKTLKQVRLEEAQAMAAEHARSVATLVAAAPQNVSATGTVSRAEFTMMLQMIQQLQSQVVKTHTMLANMSSDEIVASAPAPAAIAPPRVPSSSVTSSVEPALASMAPPERKKPKKKEPKTFAPLDEDKPLTLKEQEQLTETINSLEPDKLPGVIQIIRESAKLNDDEDEIDLEIDQLDTVTQRKLQRYVAKVRFARVALRLLMYKRPGNAAHLATLRDVVLQHVKPPRKSKAKAAPKKRAAPPKSKAPPAKKAKTAPAPKPADAGSFFSFGGNASDSESEDEDQSETKSLEQQPSVHDSFNLGDGLEHHEDDDDDDLASGGLAASWNVAAKQISNLSSSADADKDDDAGWVVARQEAEANKAREAERKALEAKILSEAEQLKHQRLADAAARGEEILAQRQEEEAHAEKLREQKEKQAADKRKRAMEKARAELESVEQTVDLDAQREIMNNMKQYENFGADGEMGDGASPSSDFGF